MSLPFREYGIGSNVNIAFEYCIIKELNKNGKSGVLQKKKGLELRMPDGMSSSKLELYIWIAHTVPALMNIRELTETEKNYYEFIKNYYGDKYKDILSTYNNSNMALALPLDENEEKIWKSKNNCKSNKNSVWRFIGTT